MSIAQSGVGNVAYQHDACAGQHRDTGWCALVLGFDPDYRPRRPEAARRVLRETVGVVRGPLLRGFYREMKPFMRRGFHPDDIDTNALLNEWQDKLFGVNGELVDHLR